ncbi:MAG: glutaredoxin [Planctomycetes bacterium]|nr:glutaredoxin [Planctomycetota bacterium]
MTDLKAQMEQLIAETPILLFTKGNKMFPRCGFSAAVIDVFNQLGVPFETVDIFEDPAIKPTLSSITEWPTTPQVFVGGKFVGGGDIVREMHANGDLKPLVDKALGAQSE